MQTSKRESATNLKQNKITSIDFTIIRLILRRTFGWFFSAVSASSVEETRSFLEAMRFVWDSFSGFLHGETSTFTIFLISFFSKDSWSTTSTLSIHGFDWKAGTGIPSSAITCGAKSHFSIWQSIISLTSEDLDLVEGSVKNLHITGSCRRCSIISSKSSRSYLRSMISQ